MATTHEGHKIKEILDERHLTVRNLAEAAGVTWTAAKRYVDAAAIKPAAWQRVSAGLLRLGIDPGLIRDTETGARRSRHIHDAAEIEGMILRLKTEDLVSLREMLGADQTVQDRFMAFVRGILAQRESGGG